MKQYVLCLGLVSIWILIPAVTGSTVTFDAFPREIKANITHAAAMTCSVRDTVTSGTPSPGQSTPDIRRVTSIFINRYDGSDVASVTAFDPPTALTDLGNMQVKGDLSAMSGEGSLELSWVDPSKMTPGGYTCFINGIDEKGHPTVLTGALQVTMVTPSVNDVIDDFKQSIQKQQDLLNLQMQMVNNLTHTMFNQQHELSLQKQKLNNQSNTIANQNQLLNNLTSAMNYQQHTIDLQNQKLNNQTDLFNNRTQTIDNLTILLHNQQKEIDHLKSQSANDSAVIGQLQQDLDNNTNLIGELKNCTSPNVAFMATPSAGLSVDKHGEAVIYSNIILNTGGGYDNTTGNFTCTSPGVYYFSVGAASWHSQECLGLHLNVNSNKVTSVYILDKDHTQSGFTSAVVQLRVDDVVSVSTTGPCGAQMAHNSNVWHANVFSGHLIYSDACTP